MTSTPVNVPEWQPPWNYSGDLSHVRVMAGRLAAREMCLELNAKKTRPEVYPVRDRRTKVARAPFADVAIGIMRDVVIDIVDRRVSPTPEEIEQSAVRAAAPRELAPATALVVNAAVAGYRGVLQSLRAAGDLAVDAVLVRDVAISEPQAGGGVLEWSAWGLHWIDRNGVRETHLPVWRDAGTRPRSDAFIATVARVLAEGYRAEPLGSWPNHYVQTPVQPPPVTKVRIREVGVLDGSCALLFDADVATAVAQFNSDVPPVLPLLEGGAYLPGAGCSSCVVRDECSGLPRVPGVLAVAARSPYPRSLSTTDLWTYDVCPQQAHLRGDLSLPREPIPDTRATSRGRLVHQWLETAHLRGIACVDDDLPSSVRPGPVAELLGWSADDVALAAPFLAHHIDQCPLARDGVVAVLPEASIAVHDTDADVILTTRPDLAMRVRSADGSTTVVVRETKTLALRRLTGQEELGLLHHFPQVAAAVCLLADGVDPCDPGVLRQPHGAVVELEVLTDETGFVITYAIDDPEVVLQARVALAQRVDGWIHDDSHEPRPGWHCERCPVRAWCPVSVVAAGGLLPDDSHPPDVAADVNVTAAPVPLDVLALIEAEAPVTADDDFPF